MGIPQGPDLAIGAILGTVFIFVTMTEVEGAAAYVLCLVCAAALSWSHWPLAAWGTPIEGAAACVRRPSWCRTFFFLTWLAGLVGQPGPPDTAPERGDRADRPRP